MSCAGGRATQLQHRGLKYKRDHEQAGGGGVGATESNFILSKNLATIISKENFYSISKENFYF